MNQIIPKLLEMIEKLSLALKTSLLNCDCNCLSKQTFCLFCQNEKLIKEAEKLIDSTWNKL